MIHSSSSDRQKMRFEMPPMGRQTIFQFTYIFFMLIWFIMIAVAAFSASWYVSDINTFIGLIPGFPKGQHISGSKMTVHFGLFTNCNADGPNTPHVDSFEENCANEWEKKERGKCDSAVAAFMVMSFVLALIALAWAVFVTFVKRDMPFGGYVLAGIPGVITLFLFLSLCIYGALLGDRIATINRELAKDLSRTEITGKCVYTTLILFFLMALTTGLGVLIAICGGGGGNAGGGEGNHEAAESP